MVGGTYHAAAAAVAGQAVGKMKRDGHSAARHGGRGRSVSER